MIDLSLETPPFGMDTPSGNRRVKTLTLGLIKRFEDAVLSYAVFMVAVEGLASKPKYQEAKTPKVVARIISCLKSANIQIDADEAPDAALESIGAAQDVLAADPATPPPAAHVAVEPAPVAAPTEGSYAGALPEYEPEKKVRAPWFQPPADVRPFDERVQSDVSFLRGWAGTRPIVKVGEGRWSCGQKSTKIGQDSVLEMVRLGLAKKDGDLENIGCLLFIKKEEE